LSGLICYLSFFIYGCLLEVEVVRAGGVAGGGAVASPRGAV
jgi:hypothetical protein